MRFGFDTTWAAAVQAGGLSFTPVAPAFAADLAKVQVTDPAEAAPADRTLLLLYRFPAGTADFPTDGRVVVTEQPTTFSAEHFQQMVADPPGPPSEFQSITVKGSPGILMSNGSGTVGRVQFIRDGLLFDVTGPAVAPTVAEKLAAEI